MLGWGECPDLGEGECFLGTGAMNCTVLPSGAVPTLERLPLPESARS